MPEDRSPLVQPHRPAPAVRGGGRGRLGLKSGAAKMVGLALETWPDLTMAEFASGLARARDAAVDERAVERTARVVGERSR